ncbi:polysaccharide pyruvyl transferase family protein [Arthrobacter sp. H35-D1]|uniref:polysaccharide pyruvyl transferase family protein n=1 Tax=Arthrobacter sp. H35-D1 TaxID=3046202 RepID=UPI0024B9EB27|nr:polysaccharide pyruvyl transferase family protein [Arthrobacter sp. H35-D1]MDJ0312334.1 polysaccharide pyruvyl transferase family protein [Arthrobacter sp. H35-D1]
MKNLDMGDAVKILNSMPAEREIQVLVLWADDSSPNLGVRALGRGTEALVRRVWPRAEVTFQNYGHRSPHMPFGRLRSLVREQISGRHGMQKWLSGFDLVIDTRSGDSFSDIYGMKRHTIMSAVAACVVRAGVPVVLGPQTIGPFNTVRGRLLARGSLRGARLVMARDAESLAEAEKLHRARCVLATDVVFAIDVPRVDTTRDVVLNISGLLWNPNPHVDFQRYRNAVCKLHEVLTTQGRGITLLAHVLDSGNADNDVPAIKEFVDLTGSMAEVCIPKGLDEVRSVVASANVVIGSRMHACLNALSVGTPAIPMAYSRKFEPLLRGMQWNHTVDLRDKTTDPVDAVLRHLAATDLAAGVPAVQARAHESLLLAEESLRKLI